MRSNLPESLSKLLDFWDYCGVAGSCLKPTLFSSDCTFCCLLLTRLKHGDANLTTTHFNTSSTRWNLFDWTSPPMNSRCVLNSSWQQPMKPRFPATRPWHFSIFCTSCGIVNSVEVCSKMFETFWNAINVFNVFNVFNVQSAVAASVAARPSKKRRNCEPLRIKPSLLRFVLLTMLRNRHDDRNMSRLSRDIFHIFLIHPHSTHSFRSLDRVFFHAKRHLELPLSV